MRQLGGSPPGFSSTGTLCSLYGEKASGITAHVASSSARNEYSCSIFLRLSSSGRVETGASRTGAASDCLERPSYRRNSPSSRRGSNTYFDSSTMLVLSLHRTALLVLSSPSRGVSDPADCAGASHASLAPDLTSFAVRTLDVFISCHSPHAGVNQVYPVKQSAVFPVVALLAFEVLPLA